MTCDSRGAKVIEEPPLIVRIRSAYRIACYSLICLFSATAPLSAVSAEDKLKARFEIYSAGMAYFMCTYALQSQNLRGTTSLPTREEYLSMTRLLFKELGLTQSEVREIFARFGGPNKDNLHSHVMERFREDDYKICKKAATEMVPSGDKTQAVDCLQAKDYEGCMRFQSKSDNGQESCNSHGWCIAGSGRDRFGLKKIEGWYYKEMEDGTVVYKNPGWKRILHKGDATRYVGQESLIRRIASPIPGTAGHYSSFGSYRTSCTGGYGGTANCTTTAPTKVYIPGTPGRSGGLKTTKGVFVVDCIEGTQTTYLNGRAGKWDKIKEASTLDDYCGSRSSYDVLNMNL